MKLQILYLCFGTGQIVLPDCVGLEKKIDIFLDDEKIDLPELQAVVCLNIDSWGAGVHLWGKIVIVYNQNENLFLLVILICSDEWR